MTIKSVITGDIVNSTKLSDKEEKKLMTVLYHVLIPNRFEFYRGDSLQAYLPEAREALRTALLCRTAAISQEHPGFITDVRISIGVGHIKKSFKTLALAKGEAFVLSGRAFDKMNQENSRLVITTFNLLANEGLQVIADYINSIFQKMTPKQAEVIFELLKGYTQEAVARKLKRSKSTINQHVNAGRWTEIEKLLYQFKNIINHLS